MNIHYVINTGQNDHPIVPNSSTPADKQPIISTNKVQQLPNIKQTNQDEQANQEEQINQDKQAQKNKLAATLKQLDQYKLIRKQSSSEDNSQQQDDDTENEKIRKVTVSIETSALVYK